MSQAKLGVFICPSCGGVVKSDRPLGEGVTCGVCLHEFGKLGDDAPVATKTPKILKQAPRGASQSKKSRVIRDLTAKKIQRVKQAKVGEPFVEAKSMEELRESPANDGDEEILLPDGSKRVKRRKKRPKKEKHKGLILFLLGWMSVIGLVFAFYQMRGSGDSAEDLTEEGVADVKAATMKLAILKRYLPAASSGFKQFVLHPTNEGREQYIDHPAELALAFSRHYRIHSFPKPDSQLSMVKYNVIALSKSDFGIETIWQDEEGRKMGGVHLWDGKSWKLDWENFAPYSTESWARFRSQLGSDAGVFRLLVRKRRTSNEAEEFYLSFYRTPEFFEEDNEFRDTESPDVMVETESELGQRFLKLWEEYLAGESAFDSILAKSLDPENYMRVTVALEWVKNESGEDVIRMNDILGVEWFGERVQSFYAKANDETQEEGGADPDRLEMGEEEPLEDLDALVPSGAPERSLLPKLVE